MLAAEMSSGRTTACCIESMGSNHSGEPENYQTWLSSAEAQQPVDLMRCLARGCLVLKCSMLRQKVRDPGHP